jgi:hypothetical protein
MDAKTGGTFLRLLSNAIVVVVVLVVGGGGFRVSTTGCSAWRAAAAAVVVVVGGGGDNFRFEWRVATTAAVVTTSLRGVVRRGVVGARGGSCVCSGDAS